MISITKKEKQLIAAGVVFVVLVIGFQLFVAPAIKSVKSLESILSAKQKQLAEMRSRSRQYINLSEKLKKVRSKIVGKQAGEQILSVIEQMQSDCGLTPNVVDMKPVTTVVKQKYEETSIEIKLQAVTLGQLIRFLSKVESSRLFAGVKMLEIRRGVRNSELLDVTVTIVKVFAIAES